MTRPYSVPSNQDCRIFLGNPLAVLPFTPPAYLRQAVIGP
jgi:hypothetical protein